MRACGYDGIEANIKFRLIYISKVEDNQIVLSVMTRDETLGQLYLPSRFRDVFSHDMYAINESRVSLGVAVAQVAGDLDI